MVELGELDLQLAFVTARAQREQVEDQGGAVDDPTLQFAFEVALLTR
jgi:hypothetical protein